MFNTSPQLDVVDGLPRITSAAVPARKDLLIRGAAIVSVDPDIGDLDCGDILIRAGTIAAIGPDLADQAGPDTTVIDANHMIAIPGFVDAHVHGWEGQLRGTGPGIDFGQYLGLTAFGRGPHYRPQDNYVGTLATALTALDAGITTIVDNSHNALSRDHAVAAVEGLLDSGIRGVHAVGSPFGTALDHVPATAVALRERYAGPLLSVRLFEVDPTPELWQFARDAQLWVSTELGPHTPGLEDRLEALHRAGLLTAEHAFNHCYGLSDRAWELIGGSGAAVNLSPRSDATFGLGSTVPPVESALRHASAVGLSGDNEISYGINMFAEMQTLSLRHRGELFRRQSLGEQVSADPLSPARLLEFATLGGAGNAGLAERVGSLTPGKQADIVLIRTDTAATVSSASPAATVTSIAHPGTVDTVLIAGHIRKRHGRLIDVDLDALRLRVRSSHQYLVAASRGLVTAGATAH
jgi:cytosine/adenosine deaminase-related metal-dependent hydrolase